MNILIRWYRIGLVWYRMGLVWYRHRIWVGYRYMRTRVSKIMGGGGALPACRPIGLVHSLSLFYHFFAFLDLFKGEKDLKTSELFSFLFAGEIS